MVWYANKSLVPVAIEEAKVDLFKGEKPVGRNPELTVNYGTPILTTGESTTNMIPFIELGEIFGRHHLDQLHSPLNFDIRIKYRSLVTQEAYCYSAHVVLTVDCRIEQHRNPNDSRPFQAGDQTNEICD